MYNKFRGASIGLSCEPSWYSAAARAHCFYRVIDPPPLDRVALNLADCSIKCTIYAQRFLNLLCKAGLIVSRTMSVRSEFRGDSIPIFSFHA